MEQVTGLFNAIKTQAWGLVVAYLVFALGSLLLSKKSQIDAWAESKPRLAGAMKIFRGLGLDPWLVIQGIVLIFKGRLPKSSRSIPPPPNDDDKQPPSDRTPPTGSAKPSSIPPLTPAATFLLLFGALGLIASMSSGSPTLGVAACNGAKDPSAVVKSSTALAYNGAVVAWELLDQKLADELDSIQKPTAEQLDKLQTRIDRLKRIRESLNLARAWIEGAREGGQAALEDSVKGLKLLVDELAADGVKIPKGVPDGLETATKLLGLPGG